MRDDDGAVLRYAVASNEGTTGSGFNRDAVYAGPRLLAIAGGIQNMSSPGSASAIAVGVLRRLDVLLAPRVIEDQVSADDPTWHRRRDNMWHFYNASLPKPHYAALREILSAHADSLAASIDRQQQDTATTQPTRRTSDHDAAGLPFRLQ